MGQCYSTDLRIAPRKNAGEVVRKYNEIRKDMEKPVDGLVFRSVCKFMHNEPVRSVPGVARNLLAAHQKNFQHVNGVYYSAFDASYGWSWVMAEVFKRLAPVLADGSQLWVGEEEGTWELTVRNGEAVETEREAE